MAKIKEMNGIDIYAYEYEEHRFEKANVNSLMVGGACLSLAMFLQTLGYDESAEDVFNNTSGIRDDNRVDILDNYIFEPSEKLEIPFIYFVNNTARAVIYDTVNDSYYGEFDLTL